MKISPRNSNTIMKRKNSHIVSFLIVFPFHTDISLRRPFGDTETMHLDCLATNAKEFLDISKTLPHDKM